METLVVVFSGFFNEALQADVAADIVAVMVKREQSEQAGDTAVAVPKGMDAKEIKHKGRNCDEWRYRVVLKGLSVAFAKLCDRPRGLLGRDAPEPDGWGLAGRDLDDFVVDAFELAGIAAGGLAQRVQAANGVWRAGVAGMDSAQRLTIALDFLLRPVLRPRVAQHERLKTAWVDNDPFDPIGGLGASHDRHVAQRLQEAGSLLREKLLSALELRDVVKQPDRADGYAIVSQATTAE